MYSNPIARSMVTSVTSIEFDDLTSWIRIPQTRSIYIFGSKWLTIDSGKWKRKEDPPKKKVKIEIEYNDDWCQDLVLAIQSDGLVVHKMERPFWVDLGGRMEHWSAIKFRLKSGIHQKTKKKAEDK